MIRELRAHEVEVVLEEVAVSEEGKVGGALEVVEGLQTVLGLGSELNGQKNKSKQFL